MLPVKTITAGNPDTAPIEYRTSKEEVMESKGKEKTTKEKGSSWPGLADCAGFESGASRS